MSGPLSRVHRAVVEGARTRVDIVQVTGLDPEVVDASLDHLVRMGRLDRERLASGCASGGCGSCASSSGGTCAESSSRGPVLLTLSRRPSS